MRAGPDSLIIPRFMSPIAFRLIVYLGGKGTEEQGSSSPRFLSKINVYDN